MMAEPADRFYESQGLRLHYVDWGNETAPPLILIHGGLDHCRTGMRSRANCSRISMSWPRICAGTAIPNGQREAAIVWSIMSMTSPG